MPIASWNNMLESIDNPLLKRGAPSDSSVLNNINKNIVSDLLSLSSRVEDLDRRQELLSLYTYVQSLGLQSLVNSLQTLVPAAAPGRGIADFFSNDFIDTSNTAYINYAYGQASLPILSDQTKMSSVDSQGNLWIPQDSTLRFSISSTYTEGSIPQDDHFGIDEENYLGIGNQQSSFWFGGYVYSPSYVFIKGALPRTLNTNLLANRVSFSPFPVFYNSLVGAYYRTTDYTWHEIDISYNVGYTTNTSPPQISSCGPVNLHFPPSEVLEVCVVLLVNNWWGISNFEVYLTEYGNSATLAIDMSSYNPSSINQVILGGMNPSILNRYNTNILGSKVSILLSQTSSYSSPIISYVDCRWN